MAPCYTIHLWSVHIIQGSVLCMRREYTQGETILQILTMYIVNISRFVYHMKKGDCLIYIKIWKDWERLLYKSKQTTCDAATFKIHCKINLLNYNLDNAWWSMMILSKLYKLTVKMQGIFIVFPIHMIQIAKWCPVSHYIVMIRLLTPVIESDQDEASTS